MKYLLLTTLLLLTSVLKAQLQIADIFSDHAVLQQGVEVPVWGAADAGAKITVTFGSKSIVTTANSEGDWSLIIPPLNASFEPQNLTVTSNNSTLQLTDIIVGEVCICSGQSNMQWPPSKIPKVEALLKQAQHIRSFDVPQTVAFTEQKNIPNGSWKPLPPNSAVGGAFAYFLQEHANTPIGIIHASWGSSSIEAWMPRDMVNTVPHFKTQGERNAQSMHGMLSTPWYSRNSGILAYDDTLISWIQRYRKLWKNDQMHFLTVMLPGYDNQLATNPVKNPLHPESHSWAWMRESQLKSLSLKNTAVSNNIDLGEIDNIHPKDKLLVGKRLALLAAKQTLSKNITAQGPVFNKLEKTENALTVHFKHAKGLTTVDGKPPTGFWITDNTKNWKPANASINGNTVTLTSNEIARPLYVRYAFAAMPKVNLINSANLPAYPFRSDNFPPLPEIKIKEKASPNKKQSSTKKTTIVNKSITPNQITLYKSTEQGDLNQHIFLPKDHLPTDQRTAVVCFYGGGWVGGTPKQFYAQAKSLTKKGAVVFCPEYRTIKKHNTTPFECVQDAKSSIHWVRKNAKKWGINPEKIVAIGGSAGGHIAACAGIIEGIEEEQGLNSKPNALILFNPVLDTTEKGYGREKFPKNNHLELSLCHQIKKIVAPTLIFHGTADRTVPYENAERFTNLMKEAGNNCTLISYKGAGHGFFNSTFFRAKTKDDSAYHSTLKEMIIFLEKNSFLD